ncbi:hypothetical protein R5R35_006365 [Gryllus longicercus]|uniref:Tubulin epsilon and delta complex protein 1 domain-containing protein n=1 Tax=Gryllus longicercus TaxID=2509291 RepID=A0AAN9VZA4_9ORTH
MSDIKSNIALLCKYLKILYGCNMKNEHFRLAKFNSTKEDTVSQFWQLLFRICHDEFKVNIFYGENIVNFVKLNLALLKYDSLQFYSLPTDMSSGSRELLLAFAWLLASQDILERATHRKIVNSNASREYAHLDFCEISTNETDLNINIKTLQSACDCLLWYAGKISQNLRAIDELGKEWMHITTKIHSETQNACGLPHLSTGDAKLIYDTKDSSNGYEHLFNCTLLLETRSSWSKKCSTFWEWMETVVAERDKEVSQAFGIEARCLILRFIKVLKRIIQAVMFERKSEVSPGTAKPSTSEEACVEDEETFLGVPRFILHSGNNETDMAKLLSDLTDQETHLKTEYSLNIEDVKNFLGHLSKKLNGVTFLNI